MKPLRNRAMGYQIIFNTLLIRRSRMISFITRLPLPLHFVQSQGSAGSPRLFRLSGGSA